MCAVELCVVSVSEKFSTLRTTADPFACPSRIFEESEETETLKEDLENIRHTAAQATIELKDPKRRSHHRPRQATILREHRMAPRPNASQLLVQSLSVPPNRPRSVRISTEEETKIYESNLDSVMFVDQAAQDGFLAVEGRWGLRFPTPGTSQLEVEEATTNLFRHSYPQSVTVTSSRLLKASPAVQIDAYAGKDVLDGAGLMRGCTPSRMGFAGNSAGEMAYITNLIPSSIRPRQAGNRWSREACFTPLQGQRSWEHGLSSDCGVLGPPSRHVQTRAGRVVEEAKQRAMQLTSPRQALSVRDDAGNYRHLDGLVTCPVDATPLQLCSPFPGTLNGCRIFLAA